MDIIKNDDSACIGNNIRALRIAADIGQTELVRLVQLQGVELTRESLVKIERGIQHVKVGQLRAIKAVLDTTYEALLDAHSPGD